MVKQVEGAAAAREAALSRKVVDLEAQLSKAHGDLSKLRTAAGSEEARAQALAQQLDMAHRKALTEVESERNRLQVPHPCP
jgi:chromosome segregation ATPase